MRDVYLKYLFMRYIHFLRLQFKHIVHGLQQTIAPKYLRKLRTLTLLETIELEIVLVCILVTVGSYFLVHFEGIHRFDAIYLSIITLAWVGYGDIVPHTVGWKTVVMIYAILGIPVFIFMMSVIVSNMMESIRMGRKTGAKRRGKIKVDAEE